MKRGKKKSLSPIIATVLLIGIVVAIGLIVFAWMRGFVKEEGTKFGENVRLVCQDPALQFKASYNFSNGNLKIINSGNIPIFQVDIKVYMSNGYQTKGITDFPSNNWPSTGLKSGEPFYGNIGTFSGVTKIVIIPILISTTSSGKNEIYTCDETYGYQISLQ
jgi:flagellin-like protein